MKNFVKIFLLFSIMVCMFCSCVSTQGPQYSYSYNDWIRPNLGIVNESAIGDTIVSEGIERSTDGIELLISNGTYGWTAYHPSGKYKYCGIVKSPIISKGEKAKLYQLNERFSNGWDYVYPQIYEFEDGEVHLRMNAGTKKLEESQYRKIKVYEEVGDYFEQQLIFTGAEGNILKFTYREFVDSVARPAFTVDATYDISKDRIFRYKNCTLEVLDYNNQMIKYKLISGFNKH